MSHVGSRERETQDRVVNFFQKELGYRYLGNWHERANNRNIEEEILSNWLTRRGVSHELINRVLRKIGKANALGEGKKLYDANREFYELLRYGVKERETIGEQNQTIWLIDWENPDNNDFAIAEEVSVKGVNNKRPDIVLYVNGIALAVLELKRSSVLISEGIRQNLDNQKPEFIRHFFATIQLVMAGNNTQGLRYGTIETPEKYFLEWKETPGNGHSNRLDEDLSLLCNKSRFLQIIHDFIVFDAGIKKTCRHNQYFGVEAAKKRIETREGGIIWHTQGSGKSLTMVWLAKWIKENIENSRVLIITDRTELDEQIEKVFKGVNEDIYRTKSGADLIATLNQINPWLICSLIHKFGRQIDASGDEGATEQFITEIKNAIPQDFKPKGDLFVFVDECHRTQSGKLHEAMKLVLPDAMFIGFTGTPLMKKDKKKSIEVFGSYIHTYKFDEAVKDGVILDLRYEARDIDQHLTQPDRIDAWFEAKTRGLTNVAKQALKKRWGTMQNLLSSKDRLSKIVNDIAFDLITKPSLVGGRGNAILVCSSVYQACQLYELFVRNTDLAEKVAIITSYQPTATSIKGEESGEGETESLFKYKIYREMLARYFGQSEEEAAKRVEEFERVVKQRFIEEPGQMRLLIVVDKLLTGFDAPPATYLYIDKKMADHNLFQAICRVNRLNGDDKEYGYIVDYKDLFHSLDKAITDYTQGAFDGYDEEDVAGILKDRLTEAKQDLKAALEVVKAYCEPVKAPRETEDFIHYFCGNSENKDDAIEREALRLAFYQDVSKLVRAYSNLANEMIPAGFTESEAEKIHSEVRFYQNVRDEIRVASGDLIDMKLYEPAMRKLIDMYITADPSEVLTDFHELGLIELIVKKGADGLKELPEGIRNSPEAMAETIENNIRKKIVDENPVNPKYYEQMSVLLDELIKERREQALDYQLYLEEILALSKKVLNPNQGLSDYPSLIDTPAKKALYDNLQQQEELVLKIDNAIRETKKADWVGDRFKEREIAQAIYSASDEALSHEEIKPILDLVKAQREYQ